MSSAPGKVAAPAGSHEPSLQSVFAAIDLIGRDTRLEEFLPHLGACLRTAVGADLVALVLPDEEWRTAQLHAVRVGRPAESPPGAPIESIDVAPPDRERLTAATLGGRDALLLESPDQPGEYPGVAAVLRGLGATSAALVPLVTAVRPVGLLAVASSGAGLEARSSHEFLQHLAGQVAVAIDNVRHRGEALLRAQQLEREREHLRTLFELTSAVVPARDLTSLLTSIAPFLRRIIPHEVATLFLLERGKAVGIHSIDPALTGWHEQLDSLVQPDRDPLATFLREGRPVDLDLERGDWTGREPIRDVVLGAGFRRGCLMPLATPRATLGFVMFHRRSPAPFTPVEIDRSAQAGTQIAMALENALAFAEIAALKERLARENVYLEEEIREVQHFGDIVGESKALKEILRKVSTVARTDTTVLLLGETGTGKELIARALHSSSERRDRTLVTVNCATSPAGLLESEWFGHERGAFTGALAQKVGRFELANQGTLFLDEIGELPLELQAKLLRVLQEHEIERLGGNRTFHVDFRLVAATNRNLEAMVKDHQLRSDLYYRLNVFPIRIPPLRERTEDIPPLVLYFVQRFAKRLRRPIDSVSRESMELLCRWPWPGNVRELQNVIERAVILSEGPVLTVSRTEFESTNSVAVVAPVTLEEAERAHILRALEESGWVVGGAQGAAARLGLKRTSLVSTMRRLGIERPRPPRPLRS